MSTLAKGRATHLSKDEIARAAPHHFDTSKEPFSMRRLGQILGVSPPAVVPLPATSSWGEDGRPTGGVVTSRRATEAEIATWREEGWVVLEGLIATDEIDAVSNDLCEVFPTPDEYQRDPEGVTERWIGHPARPKELFVWPDDGPGFRPDQHRWMASFPFSGTGVLNRLCVHPSIVDFAERALGSTDIRLYQAHASAKYSGITNYEQPIHTDRNHSWLPAGSASPWWNLEGFLYLSDVQETDNPTHLVSVRHSADIESPYGVILPGMEGDQLYGFERAAPGVRGSYLAYRSDVFHRGGGV